MNDEDAIEALPVAQEAEPFWRRAAPRLWRWTQRGARALGRSAMRVEPIDVLLAVCALFALRALLLRGLEPLGIYDEGLLFTNAQMMNDGRVPYRDFYTNYPPGIFQLVRGVMLLGLPPIWGVRLLALLVRVVSALGAGWLAGRARGGRFCGATACAVLVLQSTLRLVSYAYTCAVVLAMVIIASWPAPGAKRSSRLLCGAIIGVLSYFRHDLFVYMMVLLAAIEVPFWSIRRRSLLFGSAREFAELAAGALTTALVLWLPVFARAGVGRVVHDIMLDQTRFIMPARVLPIPPLFTPLTIPALDVTLPALFVERLRLCLLFTAVAVLASAGACLFMLLREREPTAKTRRMVLISMFTLATLPQALGRTDYWHAAFGLPLVLAALGAALGRRAAQIAALMALLPWFSEGVRFIGWEDAKRLWRNRSDAAFMSPERSALASFVDAETAPHEPIFVGCESHRRIIVNPLDVYYWAHRPGATRYMQFDPGLATGPEGQSQMVADLERTRPRLVLRQPWCVWDEPNASRNEGVALLDHYLAAHYRPAGNIASFQVWRRREDG
jgi:hypothetical protein